jgi:hypothetical protein
MYSCIFFVSVLEYGYVGWVICRLYFLLTWQGEVSAIDSNIDALKFRYLS